MAAARQQLPALALALERPLGARPLTQLAAAVAAVASEHRAGRARPDMTRLLAPGGKRAASRLCGGDLQGSDGV